VVGRLLSCVVVCSAFVVRLVRSIACIPHTCRTCNEASSWYSRRYNTTPTMTYPRPSGITRWRSSYSPPPCKVHCHRLARACLIDWRAALTTALSLVRRVRRCSTPADPRQDGRVLESSAHPARRAVTGSRRSSIDTATACHSRRGALRETAIAFGSSSCSTLAVWKRTQQQRWQRSYTTSTSTRLAGVRWRSLDGTAVSRNASRRRWCATAREPNQQAANV